MSLAPSSIEVYHNLGYLKGKSIGEPVNEDSITVVYKCLHLPTNQVVAIKENLASCSLGIKSEFDTLTMLRGGPNIVQVFVPQIHPRMLVLECLDMNLATYITLQDAVRNDFWIRRRIRDILHGVAYIHSQGMIHCNIRLENMLVDVKKDTLKITGFCFALTYDEALGPSCFRYYTNVPYQPPEVDNVNYSFSYEVDIWAVGCVFAEMFRSGRRLFDTDDIDVLPSHVYDVLGLPSRCPSCFLLPLSRADIVDWDTLLPRASELAQEFLLNFIQLDIDYRVPAAISLCHEYLKEEDIPDDASIYSDEPMSRVCTPPPNDDFYQHPDLSPPASSTFSFSMPPSPFTPGQRWSRSTVRQLLEIQVYSDETHLDEYLVWED